MKTIKNVACGALGSVLILSMVGMAAQISVDELAEWGTVRVMGTISVNGVPEAADMVRIVEGAPYIVPVDKYLVLTGVHDSSNVGSTRLELDGVLIFRSSNLVCGDGGTGADAFVLVPPGFRIDPGVTVTVDGSSGALGIAIGYLADFI